MRIIAAIEDPAVMRSILDHLTKKGAGSDAYPRPAPRAPPRSLPELPAPQLHLISD